MSNTALRMIEMLRMIPREPRKVSTTDLRAKLSDKGYDTTPRTIQRDLLTLSESFPLVCDDRSHPYGWSWAKHASAQSLPGMDTATALTFTLTEQFLSEMLPKGVLKLMEPHFVQAHQILKATGNGMLSWRNKVRALPRYQPLIQPKVKSDVVAVLYDALFRKQRVAVHYNPRNGEPRDYELNPQGLAFRDAVIYLVASQKEYDNVVMFALHRFTKATLLDTASRTPPGFDFDIWVTKGGYDALDNLKPLRLVVRLKSDIAEHLTETPLSTDQKIENDGDAWVKLSATVMNTQQLRWWLRGFGEGIEVMEPISLRKELYKSVCTTYEMYNAKPVV